MNPPKISDVIADSLIKMLIEGPEVSFNGSPTVSPMTAALCSSVGSPSLFFFLKMKGFYTSSSFKGTVLS